MQKDVIISIYGLQQQEEGSLEPVTLVTTGRYYKRGGHYFVSYDESELTGLDGTHTVVRAGPDRVQVTRTGSYPSQLVFERGRRHLSLYHTDFGDLSVCISTQHIDNQLNDDGGLLDVRYMIEIDNTPTGISHLKLNIQNVNKGASLQ
ncbi:MAG: DUF1934 domain-containing protein [Clostridiaceae bacterium]|nr:DUF1934 domain-containing protein [Clostridiaceae bacterium]